MEQQKAEGVDMGLRRFIRDLGYVAGGTALLASAPWLQGCTPQKLTEIRGERARVALIGTGSRGQYHLHNLKDIPHAEVVALCDIYEPNLEAASALFPKARTCSDYRRVLDDPEVDGIIIAVPLDRHASITLDALAAGKHVFCEKAMALTMEDCRRVWEVYGKTDRALYYCMQRLYDEKYIRGMQLIHSGKIGQIVGMRCHWFRNADWRRPVLSPELERQVNWRLYREYSGGLMTELGSHQLEVCNWALGMMPVSVSGMGDIVFWKDGREVYDSVSVNYRYSNGCKICYESLISNKFNGMEEQILGSRGTMDLSKGVYYLEEDDEVSGMRQLADQVKNGIFAAIPTAGPSWRPELRSAYVPHPVMKGGYGVTGGESMIGAVADGSDAILSAFCQSCITGQKAEGVVEEAYCSTLLCLLGNQSMEEGRFIEFPMEYSIPYMKF